MDETQDIKPHVVPDTRGTTATRKELSIWFFCGVLTLAYGIVLVVQGLLDLRHPPPTVLTELHPTLWWGVLLMLFGLFYSIRFRPRKR